MIDGRQASNFVRDIASQIRVANKTLEFISLNLTIVYFSRLRLEEYFIELSKSPRYSEALWEFTDAILCLLLRFEPNKAIY